MVHIKQNLTRKKKETEKSVLQRKAKLMQGLPQNAFSGSPSQYETEAGFESACSEPHTHVCILESVRNPHLPNTIRPPGNKGPVVPGLPQSSGWALEPKGHPALLCGDGCPLSEVRYTRSFQMLPPTQVLPGRGVESTPTPPGVLGAEPEAARYQSDVSLKP